VKKNSKRNIHQNTYKCTIDQELADTAAYRQAHTVCAFTRWQHCSAWNDVMITILKVWRQIKNPTPSIDVYLFKNNQAEF